MANPFYIAPASPLQALMLGVEGFDRSRKALQQEDIAEAGRLYAAGDIKGAQAAAARGGSLQALMGFANLSNQDRDFTFRQSEAQRAQGNADRSFGLQEKQLTATRANAAASQALQRAQFDFQREQGNRPELREVNGQLFAVDRKTNAMTPVAGAPPPPDNIPPGVDPTTYRRELAQAAVKNQAATRELQEGGRGVLAMVEQLEKKIINPADPIVAKKFGAATGPFVGPASEAGSYDPRKLAYETFQSRESKAYLDQIKQDAQAINATMQRALLKGGGAISDSERASINQILGAISQARSPEDALALLNNFKGIVRQMFRMEGGQPQAAQPAQPAGLPPLPPGFVVQQ